MTQMFFKMAAKNVRQSIRDYLVYFLTLVLAICIFYMFNSVDAQMVMLKLAESSESASNGLSIVIRALSIVMAVVLAFLVIYANGYIMKRRKREFGLYMTLGISNRSIAGMLAIETLLIGVLALVVGLACGYFASQGMSVLTAYVFETTVADYHFVFSESALISTCVSFAVIFIAVMLLNVGTVSKQSLAKLMLSGRENQKVPVRRRGTAVITIVLGIAVMILSYWIVYAAGFGVFLQILLPAIGVNFVGTLLFFTGMSGLVLSAKRHAAGYYKGLAMFTSRQLASRVTTNVVSMSFICSMLFLTIVIVSSTGSLQSILNEQAATSTPFDVSFTTSSASPENNVPVTEAMDAAGIPSAIFGDTYSFPLYDTRVTQGDVCTRPEGYDDEAWARTAASTLSAIAVSDFNEICRLQGVAPIQLADNTVFALNSTFEAAEGALDAYLENPHPLDVNGTELNFCGLPVSHVFLWTSRTSSIPLTMVVPDEAAASLGSPEIDVFVANYAIDTAAGDEMIKASEQSVFDYDAANSDVAFRMALKSDVRYLSRMNDAMMTYVGLYIGMVFLVASAAVLALQVLSGAADDRPRYELLRRLGTETSMIDGALLQQVAVYFLIPLGLAAVHSAVGVTYMTQLMGLIGMGSIGPGAAMTALLICAIYGVYFACTYLMCRSVIHSREMRRTE